MTIVESLHLDERQKVAVFELWNSEYPQQLTFLTLSDFDDYLKQLDNKFHLLAFDENNNLQGWAFIFERTDEKWFAIIIKRDLQGKGFGTLLLRKIKEKETTLNGWVIDHNNDVRTDGEKYNSPMLFYIKNNFVICSDVRLETDKISAVKIEWVSPLHHQ